MKDAEQQVKRQLGKERREAGFSKPVPEEIWQTRAVKEAMQAAVDYLQSQGKADFEEDYLLAGKLNKLNNTVNAEYERRTLATPSSQETIPQRRNARSLRRPAGKPTQITRGTTLEWHSGAAVGDFLAREMDKDERVARFRHQFNGGQLLSMEQAWEMLTSPLFQILSLYDFYHRLDLPHAYWPGRVTLLPTDSEEVLLPVREWDVAMPDAPKTFWDGDKHLNAIVEIDTCEGSVIRRRVSLKGERILDGFYPFVTREEFFGEKGPAVDPALASYENAWGPAGQEYTEAWMEDTAGSVAMEATDMAFHLQECDWPISLADALRFVLTGLPPRIAPIEINYVSRTPYVYKYIESSSEEGQEETIFVDMDQSYARAVLFIQPWVQPEAVANFWRQTRMGTNRTLPLADNLSLFQFVINRTPWWKPFPWQTLADQWNREHGQRLSRSVVKTIYSRTLAALLPTKRQESGTGSN